MVVAGKSVDGGVEGAGAYKSAHGIVAADARIVVIAAVDRQKAFAVDHADKSAHCHAACRRADRATFHCASVKRRAASLVAGCRCAAHECAYGIVAFNVGVLYGEVAYLCLVDKSEQTDAGGVGSVNPQSCDFVAVAVIDAAERILRD